MSQWLFLIRHAHAERTLPDSNRALSAKGVVSSKKLARSLLAINLPADTVFICSDLRRAIETAQILHSKLDWTLPIQQWQGLAPMDDPINTANQLRAATGNQLLVGHNPHLAHLASVLLTGNCNGSFVHFRKAAAMALKRNQNEPYWTLEWFLPPAIDRDS
jgi:phosphohistidine phosphatase SixA